MTSNNPKYRPRIPTDVYLLQIADVEKILGICKSRIRNMIREGVMPGMRIGRKWYIDRDTLNAWLASLYTNSFPRAEDGGKQSDRPGRPEVTSGTPADGEGDVNLRQIRSQP